jgi:hypothetical protein
MTRRLARHLLLLAGLALAAPGARADEESPLRATEMEVCRDVVQRTCRGSDRSFGSDVDAVNFMTRIEGATGDAYITHVWTFEGEEVRRIKLSVKRSSYRTWSTKVVKGLPGRWKAEVLDPLGRSLGVLDFVVLAPSP